MRVTSECRVLTAIERTYNGRDGLEKTYRELWVATGGLDVKPQMIRVDGDNDAVLDAFDTLAACEWGDDVRLVVDIEGFGVEQTMSVSLVGIAA